MATNKEESERDKEEEEKMEREGPKEELQEEGSLQNLTLWSKLSELAVDNEVKCTRESRETIENSSVVGVEANSAIKSVLHTGDLSETLSEDRIASVMSPSNRTKDVDFNYLPSNVQSYQIEQSMDAAKESDNQSMTEKDLASRTDCGIIDEVYLEKQAKDGTQLNSETESEHECLFKGLSANLLTRDELLALFKTLHMEKQQKTADCSQELLTTIGLVSKQNDNLRTVFQLSGIPDARDQKAHVYLHVFRRQGSAIV